MRRPEPGKIACVLARDLDSRTALNVSGHLGVSLRSIAPKAELLGRAHPDADGLRHMPLVKWPLVTKVARRSKLAKLYSEARESHDVYAIGFPDIGLTTSSDAEHAAELALVRTERLTILGLIVFGESRQVDALCGRYDLWGRSNLPALAAEPPLTRRFCRTSSRKTSATRQLLNLHARSSRHWLDQLSISERTHARHRPSAKTTAGRGKSS